MSEKLQHDILAQHFLNTYPGTAYGLNEWRRYTNGHWPAIPEEQVEKEIIGVCQAYRENVHITSSLIGSVTSLARIMCAVPVNKWDARHDLLVVGNGTLCLTDMTMQPHAPENYLTGALHYDYDPLAISPFWDMSLSRLPADVVEFLQEFAGYAITTDTRHEIAVWLYGLPGGGKSTFLEGLRAMLGGRVCNLNLGMIEKSSFALTTIIGKTLAVSAEQPEDFIRQTHILNAIISGESLTVDVKFKDPIDIIPRVKLAWAMNGFPRIGHAGNGLFRRVKVVTFAPIPQTEMIVDLKEHIQNEAAGILLWALIGLARLQRRGRFAVPQSVELDSQSFQQQNDTAALFIADRCIVGPAYTVKGSELYTAYKSWCDNNGHKPKSNTALAEDWKRLGFTKTRKTDGAWWAGVGLISRASNV